MHFDICNIADMCARITFTYRLQGLFRPWAFLQRSSFMPIQEVSLRNNNLGPFALGRAEMEQKIIAPIPKSVLQIRRGFFCMMMSVAAVAAGERRRRSSLKANYLRSEEFCESPLCMHTFVDLHSSWCRYKVTVRPPILLLHAMNADTLSPLYHALRWWLRLLFCPSVTRQLKLQLRP